MQEDISPSTD